MIMMSFNVGEIIILQQITAALDTSFTQFSLLLLFETKSKKKKKV